MNINVKLNPSKDKNRTYNRKELLSNNNKIKLINLILSKKPISLFSNLKYNNILLSNKIHILGKRYSLKNSCIQKSKVSLDSNLNNIKKMKVQDLSNYKNLKGKKKTKIKKNIDTSCNRLKNTLKNKSFYIMNKNSYEIPNDNIAYIKKKKYFIKNQKSESIKRLKMKKSLSISRNLNMSGYSFEGRKNSNKSLSNNINNFSINKNNQSSIKYLNKNKKNYSQDLKYKISLFVKELKLKSSGKILKTSNSGKNINNIKSSEKIYGNIITNNSDKENTDFSTKKNNLTTHSNNMPYFTTNFNNSTNITETRNNEFIIENKPSNKKKIIKKKLGLPFHPNSRKVEYYNNIESKNNLLIRNNKSEIYIPYNKKNNRIKKDISPFNNCRIKLGKFNIHHSARNKKNKNDSFFDLYSDINNNDNDKRYKIRDPFDSLKNFNKSYVESNNNFIILRNENIEKEELISVELAHFRIVAIIQENKKILKYQEK